MVLTPQAFHLQLIKGVLGIVATLGKVDDDNLSRPYAGEFVADDPQRRLDLAKPKLPNGECPPGFLGFAVKMINVDMASYFVPQLVDMASGRLYFIISSLIFKNIEQGKTW
uniref:Uncharacterized protein n=1 Tax=Quercus lobata TaxID=97700 RepID=A0A7N2MHB8_QUELO